MPETRKYDTTSSGDPRAEEGDSSSETNSSHGFWRKPVVLVVTAALAILLIGGGGVAIALSLADREPEQLEVGPEVTGPAQTTEPAEEDAQPNEPTDAPIDDSGASNEAAVSAEADALITAIDVAVAEAGGEGATQIEVKSNGWKVEVQKDATEVEVFVGADGSATVRETDHDDDRDPLIDTSQLHDVVRISTDAAGGGAVEQITTDDDDHLYNVDVRLDDGTEVEVELDASLNVIDVEFD